MSGEERSRNKYIRQQPAPDKPSNGKKVNGVKKPWVVESRCTGAPDESVFSSIFFRDGQWRKSRAYRDEEGAKQALAAKESNYWEKYFEHRIRFIG